MTCKRCNSELPDNSRFCLACGALQPMICPSCQAESRPGSRTCSACGKKLPVGEGTVKFYKKKRTPSQIAAMSLLTLGAVLVVVAAVMFLVSTFHDVTAPEQLQQPEQSEQLQLELIVEEPVRREEDASVQEEPVEETTTEEEPVEETIAEEETSEETEPEEETSEETPEETEPEEKTSEETSEETEPEDTASEWFFPDSSERLLTDADIAGMSSAELQIARNEIFARHGRRFSNPDLQAWFDSCSWYNGTISPNDFDHSILNATELANIQFLKAAE